MKSSQEQKHKVEKATPITERSGGQQEPERSSITPPPIAVTPVSAAAQVKESLPDPEVDPPKPRRRRFSAKEKMRIIGDADRCTGEGQIGALLRREGLYSSHLSEWRKQRERATKAAFQPNKRGRKVRPEDELARRNAQLEKEKRQLEERLRKAELIIDVQKKVAQLLGIPLHSPDAEEIDS